jgi:hypothetical protein
MLSVSSITLKPVDIIFPNFIRDLQDNRERHINDPSIKINNFLLPRITASRSKSIQIS